MDERNNHFDFDFTPIGQAIKKAREARGMTREELSGIIGYAPRHIQSIVGCAAYDFVKAAVVIGVDFTDYGLHGHTVARVLARKEDAEHRADKQPDKADNEYHRNGNPPARHNCRYQSLCTCDNRLDCRKGGFDRHFHGVGCRLGGGFCCLCRPLCGFGRSLCRCLGRIGGLLGGLNRRLRGCLCRLYTCMMVESVTVKSSGL